MCLIDEQYTKTPFYGIRRMTAWLTSQGQAVNHKRVSRLMRRMGIEAIYPKRRLSLADSRHKKFPYLLKGLTIDRADQVWSSDITYVRMRHGFVYLVAILDWFSRYVVSWAVSITLDAEFCIEALRDALSVSKPEIFNSDQGCQFTSDEWIGRLKELEITISMDGKGRWLDNVVIERFWRSIKYEDIYLKSYENGWELERGIEAYMMRYNFKRPHQSLEKATPDEVYRGAVKLAA